MIKMQEKYFGTDGIRGRVGESPMTPEFVMKLGWAAGKVLGADGTGEVLIGKDTRASGYMLESAFEAGLSAAGVGIALVGPLPTPAVAYLASTFRANAGVVISASHNPYHDNGIKFFSGQGTKISDEQQQAIEALLQTALRDGIDCVPSERLGKARRIEDAAGRYIEYCKGTFPAGLSLRGLNIVVDSANGAAYKVAAKVYEELGAKVISIHDQPDGMNINAGCGATDLKSLVEAVVAQGADVGIALDGDADRIMMVDALGEVVDGDKILYLLAKDARAQGYTGGVVGTQMSNLGLELALEELGMEFLRAKVGDRYVSEQLQKTGWRLGGENSGHILLLDHGSTGDAIIASLQVLKLMAAEPRLQPLHTLTREMLHYPQTLINVGYSPASGSNPLGQPQVQTTLQLIETELASIGRVLLRKSGTEPLIRVMVEAADAAVARQAAVRLAAVIEQV
jgi:phosphoglucosamine mutase